ncbi:MAG: hypothetical protein ACKPKO_45550, partial [Candidatus Fonsibacter sp.]
TIYSGTGDISTYGLVSAGGTITSTGNITSSSGSITSFTGTITGKNGSFHNLVVTGGTVKPAVPTSAGVYIGLDLGNTAGGIQICTSALQYVDFTSPGADLKGRSIYGVGSNDFQFWVYSVATVKMS